jgi:hypothetical protein
MLDHDLCPTFTTFLQEAECDLVSPGCHGRERLLRLGNGERPWSSMVGGHDMKRVILDHKGILAGPRNRLPEDPSR